jgi:hypothetical protein
MSVSCTSGVAGCGKSLMEVIILMISMAIAPDTTPQMTANRTSPSCTWSGSESLIARRVAPEVLGYPGQEVHGGVNDRVYNCRCSQLGVCFVEVCGCSLMALGLGAILGQAGPMVATTRFPGKRRVNGRMSLSARVFFSKIQYDTWSLASRIGPQRRSLPNARIGPTPRIDPQRPSSCFQSSP